MTDLDAIKRTIADLEKRVTRLENKLQMPPVFYGARNASNPYNQWEQKQWCRCGRDVCRYPACSSKVASVDDDPLGR